MRKRLHIHLPFVDFSTTHKRLQALNRVLKPGEHVDEHSVQDRQVSHSAISLSVAGDCEITVIVSVTSRRVVFSMEAVLSVGTGEEVAHSPSLHPEVSIASIPQSDSDSVAVPLLNIRIE